MHVGGKYPVGRKNLRIQNRGPGVGSGKPTPVFLLGEYHGQRNLAGNSPWGCKESVMTDHNIIVFFST